MKKTLFLLLLISSFGAFAQVRYGVASSEFNGITNRFLQAPSDKSVVEDVYWMLNRLDDDIRGEYEGQKDQDKINLLLIDIDAVKRFIAPVATDSHVQITDLEMNRLQSIFGHNFTKVKLNVKCESDEVEFVEVRVGKLKISYYHNISNIEKIICVSCYAVLANAVGRFEHGAENNEYSSLYNNVTDDYLKIISAKVTGEFIKPF